MRPQGTLLERVQVGDPGILDHKHTLKTLSPARVSLVAKVRDDRTVDVHEQGQGLRPHVGARAGPHPGGADGSTR